MFECLKCGTGSYRNAALVVAVIDTISTSIILILFVLGSSVMVAFEYLGNRTNATRLLDEVTDDVFGTEQGNYSSVRQYKDVAEDMGVFLIFMFLVVVDFIISYIFFDGVKSKNASKCQTWFDIRIVILVIFLIVVVFNIVYGAKWPRYFPEVAFAAYRIIGLFIGRGYLKELRDTAVCPNCNSRTRRPSSSCNGKRKLSVINLAFRRKEVKSSMVLEPPTVTVTGPEETGQIAPCYTITEASSPSTIRVVPANLS